LLALFGVWLWLHYNFDKKDAEGLTIYVVLIIGLLGMLVDRKYIAKRGEKE
jgi:hypothetical protein